ncbi:ATP-binding protein [Flammeovirga sp. SJP92]|uniref:sensor histidine kinase n=1 Tax=Flammeovirga sp. SJP92 TaxID=1775430 RepID=UPI000789536D|nr:ATP-binding protein [Flammeovirga sp. SJP92]KXX72419.1 hypothetical protein AVL50_02115 [Flammeovirga sp. SJP92]
MKKYLIKFIELGIHPKTSLERSRRIRFANSMSLMGILTSILFLLIFFFTQWSDLIGFIIGITVVSTFVPPILNFYQKTTLSRVVFVLAAAFDVILLTLYFGPKLHIQYFLFALTGYPLILFGKELKKWKYLLSSLMLVFYILLYFYFIKNRPFISIDVNDDTFLLIDCLIFLLIYALYFFFERETDYYSNHLSLKTQQLEEKNIELEQFASIASHDLHEPLRTVDNFVEIIKEEYHDDSNENAKEYFHFIHDALKRMQDMIDNLLEYTRLGKGKQFEVTDINKVLDEVQLDLHNLIQNKKVIINCTVMPQIFGLKSELKQVFQNLISNGIKFQDNTKPPELWITDHYDANSWIFCIADNGIGIDHKKHHEIFQMFNKLHSDKLYKGQGIGLAFCKKIIELHQGKIWVESEKGMGSRFYFSINKNLTNEEKAR